jgi:hypothetical protein
MKLELEQHNFKINSTGWTKKHDDWSEIDYLENPKGDVWEIDSGEFKGEQLFTWGAAMRETKIAGKRIPTDKEWSELLKNKNDIPNLKIAGYRDTDGTFLNLGSHAYFWSSSPSDTSAWNRYLNSGYETVNRGLDSKAYGFSCRCIKENNQKRDSKGRFKGKYENAFDEQFGDAFATIGNLTIRVKKPAISIIKVEPKKTTYKLSHGDFAIFASINKKGKITIKKPKGFNDFVFEHSSPKTIKAIGELLIKASEIK